MSRITVITGGTRGIGEAISLRLHRAGYRVIATYIKNDKAAGEFSDKNGIPVYKYDVGDFEQCADAVNGIREEHGPVEILVNNAGIIRDVMMHKMEFDKWDIVLRTNLTSCFNMCRCVINSMREKGFGRIVNISSLIGQTGQFGQTNYSATKAGIFGFTKSLALESAGKGITVNAIAPGYVGTDMVRSVPEDILEKIKTRIPVGRLAEPEEIARGVEFLVADEAGFITGSTLTINGGQYMD